MYPSGASKTRQKNKRHTELAGLIGVTRTDVLRAAMQVLNGLPDDKVVSILRTLKGSNIITSLAAALTQKRGKSRPYGRGKLQMVEKSDSPANSAQFEGNN